MNNTLASRFSFPNKFSKLLEHKYARLMRLDKPVGILLCLYPALWGVLLGSHDFWKGLFYLFIMVIGSIVVRSFGCIVNDIFDREFDKKVERTKNRPIASGEVTVMEAMHLAGALAIISLALLLTLPLSAIKVALFFAIPIALYPLIKRFSFYPQIFLGFVFTSGSLIGWNCVYERVSYVPVLLYTTCIIWTICFDTIYALQDMKDDKNVGVKSLALVWGEQTPNYVWYLYQLIIVLLIIIGLNTYLNFTYYLGIGLAAYHLYWQTATLDVNDPKDCGLKFRSNTVFGLIVLISILIGKI